MRPNRINSILLCALVAFSSPVICGSANKSDTPAAQDLRFREVLYYLYQQQYQTALTYLETIKQDSPNNRLDRKAEIVSGELNLAYGLLDKAENIFQHLLEKQGTPEISNETWLELARVYYTQNLIENSVQAFSHIQATPLETQQSEYELLDINLRIAQRQPLDSERKFDQGIPEVWRYYTQHNLGTGLIRNNHPSEGLRILDELGSVTTNENQLSDEIKAIKDKTNTTLGYYYLDAHNAPKAISYFEKVRLNSPYTNKALLGMGWAYAELGDMKHALTPWMELQKGVLTDSAVQESLLTVPYALNELKAQRQALDLYNVAIDRYKKEIQLLQSEIDAVKINGWLVPNDNVIPDNLTITYQDIRDALLDNFHLDSLATDTVFLRTVNHYNELNSLRQTLTNAQHNIRAYQSYLINKRQLVRDITPDTLHRNYVNSIESSKNLSLLKQELARIAKTEDALALMTEMEQSQLRVLKLVNDNIADLSRLFNLGRLDDKIRIYRGIILWDITMEYDERLKKAQQSLANIEKNMASLSLQRDHIKGFENETIDNFDNYELQLLSLEEKITIALRQIDTDIALQKSRLTDRVVAVLEERQSRLKANLGQAYTSITQLYELAYLTGQKGNKQ